MTEYACVLIKLYLQKQAADWIWSLAIVHELVVYTEEAGENNTT